MNCQICETPSKTLFETTVLGKYRAVYQYCDTCDYIFAVKPFWLDEAYSEAIAATDTDIAARNIFTALRLAAILYLAFGERGAGRYVDIAGGHGLLTRLMRDLGFDWYWSDRYANNIFARGFEYQASLGPYTAVTAIEAVEHTINPMRFIQDNLAECGSDTLLFTTEVFADGHPPQPSKWDYYSFETGQHVSFFSERGLSMLAKRLGLEYIRLGRIHLFTRHNLSPLKLKLASHKALVTPLALFAAARLGSKKAVDRSVLVSLLRQNQLGTGKPNPHDQKPQRPDVS